MTFSEWIFSSYPNPKINGIWGWLHTCTFLLCIAIVITIALLFRNKSVKVRRRVLFVLASILLLFEIVRRVTNFMRETTFDSHSIMRILLFRPMCAMMSFAVMLAVCINKKWMYNFATIGGCLTSFAFFIHPGVGFHNQYILFGNLYSIVTHAFIFIIPLTFIQLKFTEFRLSRIWESYLGFAICVGWSLLQAFVLKIEDDAMLFLPNNDINEVLKLDYGMFLFLYIMTFVVVTNLFYIIGDRKNIKKYFSNQKIKNNQKK